LREARQLTASELARRSGLSVPFVSLVERGQRQPSLQALRKVARALDVPAETLVIMAVGTEVLLRSCNPAAARLTRSVRKLLQIEDRLRKVLWSKEMTSESRKRQSR
jgi:transcriptional regulator with XRE-family HTH domain